MPYDRPTPTPEPGADGARFPNPHNLPLFPLGENSKAPRSGDAGYWETASPDATKIPPGCNAAVLTGNGLIVLDLDVKGGKNGIRTLQGLAVIHDGLPTTFTVETPSGGRHLYFRGPPGSDFGQGVDRLGSGIDVKAGARGYVVAPGSVIDGKAYEIANPSPIAEAPPWLLEKLAKRGRRGAGVPQTPLVELDTEENIEHATAWLLNEAPEAIQDSFGDHTTANIVVPKLKDFGISEHLALDLLLAHWNDTKASPPWDPSDLEKKVHSGYKSATLHPPGIAIAQLPHHEFKPLPDAIIAAIEGSKKQRMAGPSDAATGSVRARYVPIPLTQRTEPPPPREWVWEGLIPRKHVTTLFGDGGTGKTLLAQQLATIVAMPSAARSGLFGKATMSGPVVALLAEDDEDELLRRQHWINAAVGAQMADLGSLHLLSGHGCDNLLVAFGAGNPGGKPLAPLAELRSICARARPVLVIIDNIADTFGGDEIRRSEVTQFLRAHLGAIARDFNCAVLLLGHPSVAGSNSGSGLSGSTAWNNGVRSRLYLRRDTSAEAKRDSDLRILESKKSNYGPTDLAFKLRWQSGALVHVPDPTIAEKLARDVEDDTAVLQEIERAIARGENISPNSRAGDLGRLLKTASLRARGVDREQLTAALDRLISEERLHVETYRSNGRGCQRYKVGPAPQPDADRPD